MKKIVLLVVFACCINMANAQWQETNGPYGGNIFCIATNGTNIFAGTYNGVFFSTNNGSSWTSVNTG